MWVLCTETAYFASKEDFFKLSEELAIQEGNIYYVVNIEKDPVRELNGEQVELAKGDWYQFAETGDSLHYNGRFKELAEDSEEVMNHVNKYLEEIAS